jgi:hypothetical protein
MARIDCTKPKPLKRPSTSVLEPKVERQERISPATLFRKWQIDCDCDDNEHQLKWARLTSKNLAQFNKMGRKKGTNKRSASAPAESTGKSGTTETTSTASSGFAMQARKNGILDPSSSKPPKNLEDIRKWGARSRATAPPLRVSVQ